MLVSLNSTTSPSLSRITAQHSMRVWGRINETGDKGCFHLEIQIQEKYEINELIQLKIIPHKENLSQITILSPNLRSSIREYQKAAKLKRTEEYYPYT